MDALSTQIASRKFDTVRRGYDTAAVDSYLDKVGTHVARLEDELRAAKLRVEALERQSRDVRDADTVVRTAFLAAAETKAKLISEAEVKAAEILSDAEGRARQMTAVPAGTGSAQEEATALLLQARRTLADSEREAAERRADAERDALAIIEAARARVAGVEAASMDSGAAADELQRIMETLGQLKKAARQGLSEVASIEADMDAVVAESPGGSRPSEGETPL